MLASGDLDPVWPSGGRPLNNVSGVTTLGIVSDDANGAIVTWLGGGAVEPGVYAQRVLASGVEDPAWPVNGCPLSTTWVGQYNLQIISDAAGGAIVTWGDFRSGTNTDIYAQRVLASGVVDPAWPVDGRALSITAIYELDSQLTSDGAGGAIVTWRRDDVPYGIYAQHVLASGVVNPAWPIDGRALCMAPHASYPQIASDGTGGAIVTWADYRSGDFDIYAQRVDSTGLVSHCPTRNVITSFDFGPGASDITGWQSLGDPDGRGTPLGYLGSLVLHYPEGITDGTGPDLLVYELGHSFPPAIDENYLVEASLDGNTFATLGDTPGDVTSFDLATGALPLAHYIRITDLPPREQAGLPEFDPTVVGADIDAVVALNCPSTELDCANAVDEDGDGLLDCADPDCRVDADVDGAFAAPCGDCDDRDPSVHPGAQIACRSGLDFNCNEVPDCDETPCADVDSDDDGLPDCQDTCPFPEDECQFVAYTAPGLGPASQFDVVVAVDARITNYTSADFEDDVAAIVTQFQQLSLDPAVHARVTFRSYLLWAPWPYCQLRRAAQRHKMDAILIRVPQGLTETLRDGTTKPIVDGTWMQDRPGCERGLPLVAYVVSSPRDSDRKRELAAIHELGHVGFGLADEYWETVCVAACELCVVTCKNTPCRARAVPNVAGTGLRSGNVWRNRQDCVNLTAPFRGDVECYPFCEDPGNEETALAWRLGDCDNKNLMRGCLDGSANDYGDLSTNGYGLAGNCRVEWRVKTVTKAPGLPTPACGPSGPTASSTLYASASESVGPSTRRINLALSFSGDVFSVDSIGIRGAPWVDEDTGTQAVAIKLLSSQDSVMAAYIYWDRRFPNTHDAPAVAGTARFEVPHANGAQRWELLDSNGALLAKGGLGAAFLEYCRSGNWTDLECWETDADGDSIPDRYDNCPYVHNPEQTETYPNGVCDVSDAGAEELVSPVPSRLVLEAGRPNPFNPSTTIAYYLPISVAVRLSVHDVQGRLVATLVEGPQEAGWQKVTWDGRDHHGINLSSGIYLIRLVAGDNIMSRKVALVR